MSLAALSLLIVAALLHTGWNVFLKLAQSRQIFTWWALTIGTLLFSPILIVSHTLPARVWPYIVASALMELLYFIALIRAYSQADFSLVYPVARGAAPALLALGSLIFLGDRPSTFGIVGLVLVLAGLVVIGSGELIARRGNGPISMTGIGSALLVASCIAVYSLIDGAAVKFAPPEGYTVLVLGMTVILAMPVLLVRYGHVAMLSEWRANWQRFFVAGVLSVLAYMLVLYVYSFERVSYAGAIREVSIVFAAIIGWRWLGEQFGLLRIIGAISIFSGIVLIAVAG